MEIPSIAVLIIAGAYFGSKGNDGPAILCVFGAVMIGLYKWAKHIL